MATIQENQRPKITTINGVPHTVMVQHRNVSPELQENLRLLHSFFSEDTDEGSQTVADKIEEFLGDKL